MFLTIGWLFDVRQDLPHSQVMKLVGDIMSMIYNIVIIHIPKILPPIGQLTCEVGTSFLWLRQLIFPLLLC